MTKKEERHALAQLMRERHNAGNCVALCPACAEEAREKSKQAEPPVFEIMPRHYAEAYRTEDAVDIADALTVLSSPLFRGMVQVPSSAHIDIREPVSGKALVFSSDSLWEALHAAAEYLRHAANPRLDKHRAQIMADKGLTGEWAKWE